MNGHRKKQNNRGVRNEGTSIYQPVNDTKTKANQIAGDKRS